MAVNEIHLGDKGTLFEITVMDGDEVVDISGATTKKFTFKKPSLTTMSKDADFVTDGKDGKLKYVTAADDLNEIGRWELQVYIVMTNWTGHSDVGTFHVHQNL